MQRFPCGWISAVCLFCTYFHSILFGSNTLSLSLSLSVALFFFFFIGILAVSLSTVSARRTNRQMKATRKKKLNVIEIHEKRETHLLICIQVLYFFGLCAFCNHPTTYPHSFIHSLGCFFFVWRWHYFAHTHTHTENLKMRCENIKIDKQTDIRIRVG